MAGRIYRNNNNTRNSQQRVGNVSIQAVPTGNSNNSRSSGSGLGSAIRSAVRRNNRNRGTVRAVTTIRSRSALSTQSSTPTVRTVSNQVQIPGTTSVASFRVPLEVDKPYPQFTVEEPYIERPPARSFSEDTLDISENRVRNNSFIPIEINGISSFVPEIIQITDFKPIWNKNLTTRRYFQDFSSAGKLIDIQYNTLQLRKETTVRLLSNMAESKRENTPRRRKGERNTTPRTEKERSQVNLNLQLDRFKRKTLEQFNRTKRAVQFYNDIAKNQELIRDLFDLKVISKSSFDRQYLSLEDFFQQRMGYSSEQFRIFSDTKILQQLLADFKSICENYSTNLLGLLDTDRNGDNSPILLDRTYTLNDGFTFSIEQISSPSNPINASERSFFNTFLNSLPNNPDDRVKLLVTILSKEYRVSRGLGIASNQTQLNEVFGGEDTGSPFDNIIGEVGENIFESPRGPESLLSTTILSLNENSFVLPFERKYVDANTEEGKKTYVPGSSYFVDSLLNVTDNNFNTQPFESYANQFVRKFNTANGVITNLFSLTRNSSISSSTMNDRFLSSFRNSVENTTDLGSIDRNQAITTAVFKLANTDNELKSKLFQFCLLVGLASNNTTDSKPIFRQLANELRTIDKFSEVRVSGDAPPGLSGGLRSLRPFIEKLATDIENRIYFLTSPVQRVALGISLTSTQTSNQTNTSTQSQRTGSVSPFSRLSVTAIGIGETGINIERFLIKSVLLSNVDPRSSSVSSFVKEFVNLANDFAQAAAYNGETSYLVQDLSGRTRYNFISTSTQLLMVFEILSSYIDKYGFATFENTPSVSNAIINVDVQKNDFVINVIDDLIGEKTDPAQIGTQFTSRISSQSPLANFANNAPTTTSTASPTSTGNRYFSPNRLLITRSESSANSNKTSLYSSILSRTRNDSERELITENLGSAFLGDNTIKRIGVSVFSPMTFNRISVNLRNSMVAVRNKINTEDIIIKNILNILQVINKRVQDSKGIMKRYFTPATLESFLSENSLENLEIARNPAQSNLAHFRLNTFLDRTRTPGISSNITIGLVSSNVNALFLDSEIVSPESRIALYSLLSENDYLIQNQADKRIKVVSVGVPAGFSKQLSDRVKQSAINADTFKDKEFDVVSINVYKRDQRFDDIVFKPQSFFFDLSLFQNENRIKLTTPVQNERFERLINRISLEDYTETFSGLNNNRSVSNRRVRTYQDIVEDEKYNFLTNEQKRSIVRNHTVSSLMEIYVRLLTGMRVEEESFTISNFEPGTTLDEEFVSAIFFYIREVLELDVPQKPFMEILTDPEIDDEAKDIIRLFVFGDIVFEPERLYNQVVNPKLFDRIFHIPLNVETFEIDEELTRETESGRLALRQTYVQQQLIRRGDQVFFRPKERNELLFEDYFVTIENVT